MPALSWPRPRTQPFPRPGRTDMLDILVSQTVNGLVLGFIYVPIAVVFPSPSAFWASSISRMARSSRWAPISPGNCSGGSAGKPLSRRLLVGLVGMALGGDADPSPYGASRCSASSSPSRWPRPPDRRRDPASFSADGKPFNPPPFLAGIIEVGPLLITKYRAAVLGGDGGDASACGRSAWTPYGRVCAPAAAIPKWSNCSASTCRACSTPSLASAARWRRSPACSPRPCGRCRRPCRPMPSCPLSSSSRSAASVLFRARWSPVSPSASSRR